MEQRNGFGNLYDSNGALQYRGHWVNDERHGLGVVCWSDGSFWKGRFRDDLMHGVGVWVDAPGVRSFDQLGLENVLEDDSDDDAVSPAANGVTTEVTSPAGPAADSINQGAAEESTEPSYPTIEEREDHKTYYETLDRRIQECCEEVGRECVYRQNRRVCWADQHLRVGSALQVRRPGRGWVHATVMERQSATKRRLVLEYGTTSLPYAADFDIEEFRIYDESVGGAFQLRTPC